MLFLTMREKIELTILMSCLNEAETLETCIRKAQTFLDENNVDGEVLIAGSKAALGEYVIMGDADDSYDFLHLIPFVEKLREGYDLVMGNRFKGGIEKGAMPPLHRYLGNPVLSFIGRLFYPSKIGDFHCGLRGYNRERILALDLQTTGMEYASEMVVKCTLNKYKMIEVPTTLSPDGRSGSPHLRSWSDVWGCIHYYWCNGNTIFCIYKDICGFNQLYPYNQIDRDNKYNYN